MKLKFWKKEVEEKKLYSLLVVTFANGSNLALSVPATKGRKIAPWIDFWKWYFVRESPRYSINYKHGSYLVDRENIKLVHIFTEMR